jgi:concanavalin A-like lectin/glucanase superfamily protein
VSGANLWDNANEYSAKTQRFLSVYRMAETADLVPAFERVGADCKVNAGLQECKFSPEAPVYTVQIRHYADGKGAVLLAHISSAYQSNNKIVGLAADKVTAYFGMSYSSPPPQASLSGRIVRPQDGTASLFRASEEECDVLKRGRGWELLSPRRDATFDALSLRGDISSAVSSSTVLMAKSVASLELRPPGPELLHVGFAGELFGNGVAEPPITFNSDMSIELLITPGEKQVPYADILSNHATDFRGIAVEQLDGNANQYEVALGNGKEWMYIGDFTLLPGRRSYISLQVNDNKEASLYVNGELVAHKTLAAPVASSDRPVYVGNWVGGGRQFNGLINEVLIAKGTRSGPEVHADSERLLGNGSAQRRGD